MVAAAQTAAGVRKAGSSVGAVIEVVAEREPYLAFDYALLSTDQIADTGAAALAWGRSA